MKKATRLKITGTVQGMFYKQFVKELADKHEIAGFLRKLDDGRIEIFAEGDTDDVEEMVKACKAGPRHASIRSVEETEEKFQDLKGFKIFNF